MRGAAALFATLYLLRVLVAEANTALSALHIWLFTGGLYVAYAALARPFREGMTAAVLGGCVCDCMTPVPFGTHAALFAVAHTAVYNLRERLQREETLVRVGVALVLNLAFYVLLTAARLRHVPEGATAWPRAFADLLWSQAAVALAGPWFFALQARSLHLARALPDRLA
jgi:rod shape-determining protein MreD